MDNSKKQKLFLTDSMALIYRAYFAFQQNPLITSKGENVSAVFGFLKSILKILDEQQPDFFAAVFDTREPTFRHQIYPEYKATREKMPDEMSEQLPRIRQVLETLNIPIIEVPGLEADDVMGILAKIAEQQHVDAYLVTGDKDFMQLVNDAVKMYYIKRLADEPEILDREGVVVKLGVPPEKVIDFFSLTGDSSDNIPGVPQIGPKTAETLLSEFENLDHIYSQIDKVKPERIRKLLQEHKDQAYLSRKLVTIDTLRN
ncbi:MAG TPA: DNA polymerase I, partial [bacterium]|nr:DNA polymerase I [bacterium]